MENEISHQIIGAAIEVHRSLGGPGLLESIYEAALCHELSLRKLNYQRQLSVPVKYKDIVIRDPLCLDVLVEGKVIIEVKATEKENRHLSEFAFEAKFDDFFIGWVRRKSTYPEGRRRFAVDQTNKKSADFARNGISKDV